MCFIYLISSISSMEIDIPCFRFFPMVFLIISIIKPCVFSILYPLLPKVSDIIAISDSHSAIIRITFSFVIFSEEYLSVISLIIYSKLYPPIFNFVINSFFSSISLNMDTRLYFI